MFRSAARRAIPAVHYLAGVMLAILLATFTRSHADPPVTLTGGTVAVLIVLGGDLVLTWFLRWYGYGLASPLSVVRDFRK